ncbi:hypothetical protein [Gracilibacillus sp. JCM 18860]|uniref:hypothetical protein n=1 Tax=Gracilibacillus sp. JCM 18860 TaxID=1306159 RepID=UPI003261D29B
MLFIIFMLVACQKQQTDANSEQSTLASQDSSDDQTDENNETTDGDDGSSSSNEKGTQKIQETVYSSEVEARATLDAYRKVDQTNTDLGHGIKAFTEGAAGHAYTSWTEGNWYIEVDFPSNPAYTIENYEDGKDLSEEVVNYLEEHYLPAPDKRGTIEINGFKEHPETIIKWQEGSNVYKIDKKTSNL